jgi:putative polyhydroxyalkanoate system protein
MADIEITQPHNMTPDAARAAAQQVADKMAADFGMECAWDGQVLRFERSGVDGALVVGEHDARLEIRLGLMMKAFAPMVQDKLARKMQKVFGAQAQA